MTEMLLDALADALNDTVKLIPFLFVTYVIMEWLERRTGDKSVRTLSKVGRMGPVFGGIVGVVPQCGFSAAAASLYSGGLISIGTLLAVFLSTSDEMLPMLISEHAPLGTTFRIVLIKALIGVVSGLIFDFLLRFTRYKHKTEKHIRDLCEEVHGNEAEDHGIWYDALMHTLQITLFVFIISLLLTFLVEGPGAGAIEGFLNRQPVVGVLLAALIGLILNCASSVAITQLYLDGLLGAGDMMAGLLVSAGVGLLVLYRTNHRHLRENIRITGVLYFFGAAWGLLIEFAGIRF